MEIDDATAPANADDQQPMDPDWGGLLQEFSRMGTTDRDVLIQRMQQLAEGLSDTESAFFLDMNNWNLEAAVWSYFEFSQNFASSAAKSAGTTTTTTISSTNSSSNSSTGAFESGTIDNSSSLAFEFSHLNQNDETTNGPYIASQWALQPAMAMSLVEDRTVGNGEAVTPDTPFVKTWRVRNSGPQPWPSGSVFKYVSGDVLQGDEAVLVKSSVAPNEEIDLSLRLLSPAKPGQYHSQWRLHDDKGPFGDTIWIAVQVQEGGVLAVTQQMDACHA